MYSSLEQLIIFIQEEVEVAARKNKQYSPQAVLENNLFSNLIKFSHIFLNGTIGDIDYMLKEQSDTQLVVELLHQNDLSVKGLDNYLDKYEKDNNGTLEEDKRYFECSFNKAITQEFDKKFMNSGELETPEEKFWEKMDEHI